MQRHASGDNEKALSTFTGSVRLGDLLIRNKGVLIPVSRHPYAVALRENNKHTFKRYTRKGRHERANDSWRNFCALAERIRMQGFDGTKTPHIHVRWCVPAEHGHRHHRAERGKGSDATEAAEDGPCVLRVTHGRHRIAILCALYGDAAVLHVADSRVLRVDAPARA